MNETIVVLVEVGERRKLLPADLRGQLRSSELSGVTPGVTPWVVMLPHPNSAVRPPRLSCDHNGSGYLHAYLLFIIIRY